MECPVTSAAGAACAAPAATALPPLCAGRGAASCALVRAPSYADMVRRPASPPAEAAPRPPPATADTALVASLYSQLQALRVCSGDSCRTADAIVMPGPTTTVRTYEMHPGVLAQDLAL